MTKTVEVSDEAYDRVMKGANGAPFDYMLWNLIRSNESAHKSMSDMMGTILAGVIAKDKDDFKKLRAQMVEGKKEREQEYET